MIFLMSLFTLATQNRWGKTRKINNSAFRKAVSVVASAAKSYVLQVIYCMTGGIQFHSFVTSRRSALLSISLTMIRALDKDF